MKKLLIPFFIVFTTFGLMSQEAATTPSKDYIENEVLVKLAPGVDIGTALENLNKEFYGRISVTLKRETAAAWGLYLLHTVSPSLNTPEIVRLLAKNKDIRTASLNRLLSNRNDPNDQNYTDQWYMRKVEMEKVWDITTGGQLADGEPIVMAILDSGFDVEHEDIIENLWNNPGEIPNDNLDNDGNGLIDDVYGYNFQNDRGTFATGFHGLAVAGIAGAKGNNGDFVAGTNWDIQLMFLQCQSFESVAAALYYAMDQKKLYLETGGAAGANVMVTNTSLGTSGNCLDEDIYPFFSEPMDSLGKYGILSVASTANSSFDVDEEGDVPTNCPSDFLVAVTKTNQMDILVDAAYGRTSVDLGAPGTEIYTLGLDNGVNFNFDGTSASSPLVAGTIALLYSLPCSKIAQSVREEPEQMARQMKSFILDGVDPASSLATRTVSEGRLNARKSMELALSFCNIPQGPLEILEIYPNPTEDQLTIKFASPAGGDYQVRITNPLGQLMLEGKTSLGEFEEKIFTVNLGPWASGTYFVSIFHENDSTTVPIFKK
jgi:subtilisin family serine protease